MNKEILIQALDHSVMKVSDLLNVVYDLGKKEGFSIGVAWARKNPKKDKGN